jgi:hypothetical protein
MGLMPIYPKGNTGKPPQERKFIRIRCDIRASIGPPGSGLFGLDL